MKKTLLIISVVAVALYAYTVFAAQDVTPDKTPNIAKYEYLIVSRGEVYFSACYSELKSGGGKACSEDSLLEEAVTTESSLDKLGQKGWELVQVIGSPGGDQLFYFKRPVL